MRPLWGVRGCVTACGGWLFDVNEKGKAEAKRAGELMKEAGLDFDVCVVPETRHQHATDCA